MNLITPERCRAFLALVSLSASLSAQIQFHSIGDLPGGGFRSEVRDAILTSDGIVAVGTASRYAAGGDTPIKWTLGGGIVELATDFPTNTNPSFVAARVISADGNVIGGSARNAPVGGNRCPALWTNGGTTIARSGFLGGTPTFFPNVGINALSADGAVAYGFTRGSGDATVAFRQTATSMHSIGFLQPGDDFNFTSAHSASADGAIVVGNSGSGVNSLPGFGLFAYRYVHTGVGPTQGTMTALPAIAGGTWTFMLGMTSDGTKMLGASGATNAVGEVVIWDTDGGLISLGTPPGISGVLNFGGISADGETVVVATDLGVFLHNPSGWFHIQTLLTESGVDLTGWSNLSTLGISADARLIYGTGTHNGNAEGWILQLPPDFMKALGDTTPPVLALPGDLVVEATSASGAVVNFSATATDAVDGSVPVLYSQNPGTAFPLGTTTVTVSATDGAGNVATGSFTVTVRDTTAPVITSLTVSQAVLWPPNHKMVNVSVTGTATDAVSAVTFKIVGLASNEPDNGLGDGDTANDTALIGDLLASLRAERSGKGEGRVYTITVEAKDAAGNTSTGTVTVSVPKS